MRLKTKLNLLVVLALIEVALMGFCRSPSQGSVVRLSEVKNMLNGSANQVGARFPSGATYDVYGMIKPLYRANQLTFVIFITCDCSIDHANEWAVAAKGNGENVIQVFPGSLKRLHSITNKHMIVGDAVTCHVGQALAIIGKDDMAHLPVGYHISGDGTLISKQY